MAKVLVTGGAGFVGSNLTGGLLNAGYDVTVVDNLSTGKLANLTAIRDQIRFVEGDIRDGRLMRDLMEGVQFVFHEAALGSVPRSIADPWTSHDNNVNGTLTVLLSARDAGVQRVIYAASSSAYGNTEVLPKAEHMASTPLSPYAVTKYVGEMYCHVFHRVYGLETVALRYFNVFGPHQNPESQYAAVIPKFVRALLAGERVTIQGTGEQTRDFTYVDNVVEGNLAAATAPGAAVAGQMFNMGCGGRTSLNELVRHLQEITGNHLPPVFAEPRSGDVRDSMAATVKAKQAFGYDPKIQIRQGLELTVQWYREAMNG